MLGGNFWGNPSGTGFSETAADANRDGICDRPYAINSGNADLLPLARASGAGTVPTTAVPTATPSITATSTVPPTSTVTPIPTGPHAPFPAAHTLPCSVEAEQFDAGGEGVAYRDYDVASLGTNTALRPGEGVDIDTESGITNVGYTREGVYLNTRSTRRTPATSPLPCGQRTPTRQ